MNGILINSGTISAILYGYSPGYVVPQGQTLVALPTVAGIQPGMAYAAVQSLQTIGVGGLAAALVSKGVLTDADIKQSGTVIA